MPEDTDLIDCFYVGDNLKGPPSFRVPRHLAREQVELFQASWCNRARGIVLRYKAAEMHSAAESLRMGAHTIFAVACGSRRHRSLLRAWTPRRSAA